jgi:acetyl esterase/lipase
MIFWSSQPVKLDFSNDIFGKGYCTMRRFIWGVLMLALAAPVAAQPAPEMLKIVSVTAPKHDSIPLVADRQDTEQWEQYFGQTMVRNVTRPAIYPVLPETKIANGKAVIVLPGGGYQFVSMDSEGFRVAERLASAGYTAFVLKYRTLATDRDPTRYMANLVKAFGSLGKAELPDNAYAVDDLADTLRLVTADAAKWKIDPAQIGVIGFSAGSRTAIRLIEERQEAKLARHISLIYPPMTQTVAGGPRPPLFMAIAVDDPLFKQGGLNMLDKWLKESSLTEFHLYSGGNHGFGMRPQGTTSDNWIEHYLNWLGKQ